MHLRNFADTAVRYWAAVCTIKSAEASDVAEYCRSMYEACEAESKMQTRSMRHDDKRAEALIVFMEQDFENANIKQFENWEAWWLQRN